MNFIKIVSKAFVSFPLLAIQLASSRPFAFTVTNKLNDTLKTDTTLFINNQVTPRLVSNQFNLTEGPAVDHEGNIYFTYQEDNEIWKYKCTSDSLLRHSIGMSIICSADQVTNTLLFFLASSTIFFPSRKWI